MSNINLIFNYQGNNIAMQCKSFEKMIDIFQRFATKVQRNPGDFNFYINAMEVPPCDKTLENLQIFNLRTIDVVEKTVYGA